MKVVAEYATPGVQEVETTVEGILCGSFSGSSAGKLNDNSWDLTFGEN